jgi:hypothetical protein
MIFDPMMTAPVPIDIVLVGDLVPEGVSRQNVYDWDNPTWPEAEQLVQWFAMTGRRAEIVPSVTAFVASATEHSNKLVFPLWRGGASRNRTAIVPAVCEVHGLLYVGADAFSQSVCQDKSLSKHVLKSVGINTPPDVVFNGPTLDPAGFAALEQLRFPVVVKPLSSACSIGVTDASLCADYAAAAARASVLIEQGLGPVICEPFVAGDEISLCIVEAGGRIGLHCVAAHRSNAGTCPFRDRLFTHDEKISPDRSWRDRRRPVEQSRSVDHAPRSLRPAAHRRQDRRRPLHRDRADSGHPSRARFSIPRRLQCSRYRALDSA